ncbi:hypothetical protein MUK42_06704 [Musa troglodytarum]|uniref:Uncharacterized protein n=1 Tax=Musa troglodytarum TaxID=320322 RepID=A0A9E7KZE6_9LILI|nr:hypothetical protein MUK42_06704 [Musa troglodytarum]
MHPRYHNCDPPHHPRRLAGAPPHQAPVLPAGRGGAAVQLHRAPQQPALHRHPGDPLLPQPQRPRWHLLRPPRRLRHLQVPADQRRLRPSPAVPGPRRHRRLVPLPLRPRRPGGAVPLRPPHPGRVLRLPPPPRQDRRPYPVEGRLLDLRPLPPLRQLPGLPHLPEREIGIRRHRQVPADVILQRRRLTRSGPGIVAELLHFPPLASLFGLAMACSVSCDPVGGLAV